MNRPTAAQPPVVLERTCQASVAEVWELWTTREGIESWWGPDGFSVTVREIDLRPGGRLLYTMRATAPQTVAFMKQQGMPEATEAQIRFLEVVPPRRLRYLHLVDFVPGVKPYQVATELELHQAPGGVRLVLTLERMHDEVWTGRAVSGWENELCKMEKQLAARGARR
jgi:uncharacterized protein YndB with AHSA1/START domain